MSSRHIITEFILLIANDWNGRECDVLDAVESAGGEVMSLDQSNGSIEGRIQSMDLPSLEKLACVRQLVEGASYVTCRFPGGDDHELGNGHRGGVHQGSRVHSPSPRRSADRGSRRRCIDGGDPAGPPTLRPSARRPRPGTPARPPARPRGVPGLDFPELGSGHLDYSQRLLWKAEDRPPCDRSPRRRPGIPLGIRLIYGTVFALGVAIATHTAIDHENLDCVSMVQLLSGSLLAVLASLAACGLCRFSLVRHACTLVGVWLAVSPWLLQRSFSAVDMALGLAAFLLAGCAAETLDDT